MKLKDEIIWKLHWWKFKLMFASSDIRRKHLRRKYCRYGIHKLKPVSITRSWSQGKKIKTQTLEYLTCDFCNWKFFVSERDKKKYLSSKRPDIKFFENLAKDNSALPKRSSDTQPKHHAASGERKGKEVSARGSSRTTIMKGGAK